MDKSRIETNLLDPGWVAFDSYELRHLVGEWFGHFGQYAGRAENPNTIHLPLAGDTCRIRLNFDGTEIVSIEPGPAFDAEEWDRFVGAARTSLLGNSQQVGREITFHGAPVYGGWRGARSGVQILPAPGDWPRPSEELGDHPFILEFPVRSGDNVGILLYRRLRDHRRLTRLLDVLLRRHTSYMPGPGRTQHTWVVFPQDGASFIPRWAQPAYFADLGPGVVDDLSSFNGDLLDSVDPETYYSERGPESIRTAVPSDLDDSIVCYYNLPRIARVRFDRASYWFTMASRQWYVSVSASFASLVSSVESLTERGEQHSLLCPKCERHMTHEVPGPTRKFRDFFETYAPGLSAKPDRDKMYALRSSILHGGQLMQLDEDTRYGWDPPSYAQEELHRMLWRLMRTALHRWLRHHGCSPTESSMLVRENV